LQQLLLTAVLLFMAAFSVIAADVPSRSGIPASSAAPAVLLEYRGQYQGFFQPPRLSLALQPYTRDLRLYWPAAVLYRTEPAAVVDAEQARSEVAEQLRQLIIYWKEQPELANALMDLRLQLLRWRLAKPVGLMLDPDEVRANALKNVRLDAGRYLLVASSRPEVINVVGLAGEHFVLHQANTAAYQYLTQLSQNRWLDIAEVYQIMQSQAAPFNVKVIPVASWNRNEQALAPGSLIFLPLPNWVLADIAPELNQQLLKVLLHRVKK
jgi:hypothetical protein